MSYLQLKEDGTFLREVFGGIQEWDENNFCSVDSLVKDGKAEQFRIYPLVRVQQPEYNQITQVLRAIAPSIVEGNWTQQWEIYDLPDEVIKANLVQKEQELRNQLRSEYEQRTNAIASGYPSSERESWPVQISEARALLADNASITPWIDAASTSRGVSRTDLAQWIVNLDNAYRTLHGALTGTRQRIESEINTASGNAAALQAIDVTKGWPE